MNLLKERVLGWRKNAFDPSEEGRVIVHDDIQVRGNIHRFLPAQFSSAIPSALISRPVEEITTFTLAIGSIRIPIIGSMNLSPNLESLTLSEGAEQRPGQELENTFSISSKDGKTLHVRLLSKALFSKWHLAFREAIAELIFTHSFQYTREGHLSIRRIEIAIKRGGLLVLPAHCHILRAKRLWNIKIDLNEIVCRLNRDNTSLSREDVQLFLRRAEVDRVSGHYCSFACTDCVD